MGAGSGELIDGHGSGDGWDRQVRLEMQAFQHLRTIWLLEVGGKGAQHSPKFLT